MECKFRHGIRAEHSTDSLIHPIEIGSHRNSAALCAVSGLFLKILFKTEIHAGIPTVGSYASSQLLPLK